MAEDADTDGSLPWRRWMQIALGRMGLAPRDFWAMSLPEWRAALEGDLELRVGRALLEPSLGREELQSLMAAFPDRLAPAEPAP